MFFLIAGGWKKNSSMREAATATPHQIAATSVQLPRMPRMERPRIAGSLGAAALAS